MTDKAKTILECSVDTKKLVEIMQSAPVGAVLTYAELGAYIGRDLTNGARHILDSARRIVQRDHGATFDVIAGVGVKRLASPEVIVTTETFGPRKLRRAARRLGRRITSIRDFNELTNDLKIKHNAMAATFGVIAHMAKPSILKKIQGKSDTQKALSIGSTLDLFKKKK